MNSVMICYKSTEQVESFEKFSLENVTEGWYFTISEKIMTTNRI